MLHEMTDRKIKRATRAWQEKCDYVKDKLATGGPISSLAGELEALARLEAEYVLWHQVGEHMTRLIENENKDQEQATEEALKGAVRRAYQLLRNGPDRTTSLIKRALSDEEKDGACKFLNNVSGLLPID